MNKFMHRSLHYQPGLQDGRNGDRQSLYPMAPAMRDHRVELARRALERSQAANLKLDLLDLFPLTWKYDVKKGFGQISLVTTLLAFLYLAYQFQLFAPYVVLTGGFVIRLAILTFVFNLGVILYWRVYRSRLSLDLEGQHIVTHKGVFHQKQWVIPAANSNVMRTRRDIVDFLLGTRTIAIFNPGDKTKRALWLDGLEYDTAREFLDFMITLHHT